MLSLMELIKSKSCLWDIMCEDNNNKIIREILILKCTGILLNSFFMIIIEKTLIFSHVTYLNFKWSRLQ